MEATGHCTEQELLGLHLLFGPRDVIGPVQSLNLRRDGKEKTNRAFRGYVLTASDTSSKSKKITHLQT